VSGIWADCARTRVTIVLRGVPNWDVNQVLLRRSLDGALSGLRGLPALLKDLFEVFLDDCVLKELQILLCHQFLNSAVREIRADLR